jgi:outer membrane protein assembly factor BamD (BamD/ComL family)
MSLIGILSSNLFAAGATQHTAKAAQSSQNSPSKFQQIKTELQQLGQDLQTGNLQAAQKDFTNLQQDLQQDSSPQIEGHHHRYQHAESSQVSSQQGNPIAQAFRTLAQDLQAGNLSGAQSAFATLQNDLQQIGGSLPPGLSATSSSAAPASASNLNVTA